MAPERITTPYQATMGDWLQQFLPTDPNDAVDASILADEEVLYDFNKFKASLPWYIRGTNSDEELKYMLQERRDPIVKQQLKGIIKDYPLGAPEVLNNLVKDQSYEQYIKENPEQLSRIRGAAAKARADYVSPTDKALIKRGENADMSALLQLALTQAGLSEDRTYRENESEARREESAANRNLEFDLESLKSRTAASTADRQAEAELNYAREINRARKEMYGLESADFQKERNRQMIMDGLDILRGMF